MPQACAADEFVSHDSQIICDGESERGCDVSCDRFFDDLYPFSLFPQDDLLIGLAGVWLTNLNQGAMDLQERLAAEGCDGDLSASSFRRHTQGCCHFLRLAAVRQ
jgi:hypothetical protein